MKCPVWIVDLACASTYPPCSTVAMSSLAYPTIASKLMARPSASARSTASSPMASRAAATGNLASRLRRTPHPGYPLVAAELAFERGDEE